MPSRSDFLTKVARRIASPARFTSSGKTDSILTVAAGSYGFHSGQEEATMPTGFDPLAAALFESIVEAAFLVATADGVFDENEKQAFKTVVLEACKGAVSSVALDALMADLADQLQEDGLDSRLEMVALAIYRPEHQLEVLRIAAFIALASGGISDPERRVIERLAKAFKLSEFNVDNVLLEAQEAIEEAQF